MGAEPASQYLVAIFWGGKYHWKCELEKRFFIKMLWEKYLGGILIRHLGVNGEGTLPRELKTSDRQ